MLRRTMSTLAVMQVFFCTASAFSNQLAQEQSLNYFDPPPDHSMSALDMWAAQAGVSLPMEARRLSDGLTKKDTVDACDDSYYYVAGKDDQCMAMVNKCRGKDTDAINAQYYADIAADPGHTTEQDLFRITNEAALDLSSGLASCKLGLPQQSKWRSDTQVEVALATCASVLCKHAGDKTPMDLLMTFKKTAEYIITTSKQDLYDQCGRDKFVKPDRNAISREDVAQAFFQWCTLKKEGITKDSTSDQALDAATKCADWMKENGPKLWDRADTNNDGELSRGEFGAVACEHVPPSPPPSATCTLTVNSGNAGENCNPGMQKTYQLKFGESLNMADLGDIDMNNAISSIEMTRTNPAYNCEVKFFKVEDYGGCYCSVPMTKWRGTGVSRRFQNEPDMENASRRRALIRRRRAARDAGNTASSLTFAFGDGDNPNNANGVADNPNNVNKCGHCDYDPNNDESGAGCNICDCDAAQPEYNPWCNCD